MVTYNRRSSRVLSVGCSELIFSTNKSDDGDEEESRALWAPAKHRPSILHTNFVIFFFCCLLSFLLSLAQFDEVSRVSSSCFDRECMLQRSGRSLAEFLLGKTRFFVDRSDDVVEFFHYFTENLWDLLADFSVKIADFLKFHAKININFR